MDGGDDDSKALDRGQSGSKGNQMSVIDAKEHRLERNRESARQSRLRKKEFLGELQGAASALVKELTRALEASGASVEATLAAVQQARLSDVVAFASKAGRSADEEAAVSQAASFLVAACGPDCPERRAVRRLRFDMLRRLLFGPSTVLGLFLAHAAAAESSSAAVLPPTLAVPATAGIGSPSIAVPLSVASPETRSASSADGSVRCEPLHAHDATAAGMAAAASASASSAPSSVSQAAMAAALSSPLAAAACANAWWRSLAAGAGLAADQVDSLKEQLRQALLQRGAAEDVNALRKVAEHLNEIEEALNQQCAGAQRQLEAVAGILTPPQLILLLSSS